MRKPKLLAALLPAGLLLLAGFLAWPRTVSGVVRDANGPVAGATVRLRSGDKVTTTDAEGRFALAGEHYAPHQVVTAWKEGYNPAGVDLSARSSAPASPASVMMSDQVLLTLKRHPTADDPTYKWLTSHADPNEALGCGHCMTNYEEWRGDAHALSAQNPVFLSLYSATDARGQPDGFGWRADAPNDAGNCAACHAPAAALSHPGAADPTKLNGVEGEGVFCDLCHKIADVKLDPKTRLPDPALPGIASYALSRPAPNTQIFYGTIDDTVRRVSKLELERKSAFCAPCHSGGWWGQSAYASYDEWLASPYAAEGKECQDCHMLPEPEAHRLTSACGPAQQRDPLGELGCKLQSCVDCHVKLKDDKTRQATLSAVALIGDRPAGSIHSHQMAGSRDEAFLRSSVAMTATATQGTDGVLVQVAITNTGAGHHVPSDSPLRNMILLVEATDNEGRPLTYTGREVVPDWGGQGQGATDFGGRPGKGFAKIIEDWDGTAPAPAWRNGAQVQSDNRIPARATDRSYYTFAPPTERNVPIRVQARLIFRRAFKPWADAKGWNLPDIPMGESSATPERVDRPVLTGAPVIATAKPFAPSSATTTTGAALPQGAISLPGGAASAMPTRARRGQRPGTRRRRRAHCSVRGTRPPDKTQTAP